MANVVDIRVLCEKMKFGAPPATTTQADNVERTRLILERMEVTAQLGQRILDRADQSGTHETIRAVQDVIRAFTESIKDI